MTSVKILNDGPAVKPARATTGPGIELVSVIEKLQKIKTQVNNELAIYYLDCAISALIKASDYKSVQKQIILESLVDLHEKGIINLGRSQKCSNCGKALQPTSKASMTWTKGKGSEILCEKCSKEDNKVGDS